MKEALHRLAADIEACQARIDVDEQMPNVLGHNATLVQVATNLVSNAIRFVAAGVRPEVRVWAEPRDEGTIRLWVEDNGIGIDDAYHGRVFRVFERLHGVESYPGTGIGLAIVARACERLGGCYGIESQTDQGSRFWVEFLEETANP
jgi:signal transduction histidine kinase